MTTVYQRLRLYSPVGDYIQDLYEWKSIDCVLAENTVSPLTIALPPSYSDEIFRRDCRIVYERSPYLYGSWLSPKLVGGTTWLLSDRERTVEENGQSTILLHCEHPNRLLGSRVVAYNEGTSQAEKADIGSDVIYDIVNENFVAATDATRNLSTRHFVLDPRPAPVFGSSDAKSLSYRNILTSIQEIAKSSAQQGIYMGFEVYTPEPPGPFHFRLYPFYRGTDRGSASGQTLNIYSRYADPRGIGRSNVREDWSDIVSFVYSGGPGKKDERPVVTASDADLIAASPFGRIEFFRSSSSEDTTSLQSEAERTLREFRPRREFEGDFGGGDPDSLIYDIHYTWGDLVVAHFSAPQLSFGKVTGWLEYSFDVRVDPVNITAQRFFDENGEFVSEEETIKIHFRSLSST